MRRSTALSKDAQPHRQTDSLLDINVSRRTVIRSLGGLAGAALAQTLFLNRPGAHSSSLPAANTDHLHADLNASDPAKKYNFRKNSMGFWEAQVYDGPVIPKSKLTAMVIHWTAGVYDNGVYGLLDVLKNNKSCGDDGCSVQLYADRAGDVFQLTKPLNTQTNHAYGANSVSVGIEVEGRGQGDLLANDDQYKAVLDAVGIVTEHFGITGRYDAAKRRGVIGHYEIDPEKQDPGTEYMANLRQDLA